MFSGQAANGDITIAYERLGVRGGEPLLLVMGLGMSLLMWPDEFCDILAARGFDIARFDNRDVGASTHLAGAGTPSLLAILTRPSAVAAYRLAEMADDAVAVMDALGWPSAHVVGASLGGMIAQTLAIRHPARVRSLTSIMSTPSPRIGRPSLGTLAALGGRDADTPEAAAERMVRVFRVIGSARYPRDEAWLREVGMRAYQRGHNPAGTLRQLAAVAASGDRRPGLADVRVPTLVLHGEADPLVRPAGGRATAAAVSGSRLVTYPGMGHDLPHALWPKFVEEIHSIAAVSKEPDGIRRRPRWRPVGHEVSRQRPSAPARPRVGLVLGAGGVLGAAWMAGALAAVQERLDCAAQDVDVVVGTSAGSVLASALRCGVAVEAIVAHQRGIAHDVLPHLHNLDEDSGPLPPFPRMRLGSPQLLASTARKPHRVHPWVAASALLPHGRAQHRYLATLVQALLIHSGHAEPAARHAWPSATTWIVAVDYDSGRRVTFGRGGAPLVSLADAVVASCSIPGWFEPKRIGDRRYVDGGVRSMTSVELLARAELDEVYVLAPMAIHESDRPRNPALRAERLIRRWVADRLAEEVRKVEATGARVTVLTPGPDDLAVIGINMMDGARRLPVLETSLVTSPARLDRALARRGGVPI